MMLSEKDLALLEAYTFGDISPEEEAALKHRIQEDLAFAAAVREWELWERAPLPLTKEEIEESDAIKAEIFAALGKQDGGDGAAPSPPNKIRKIRWAVLAAASLVGIILWVCFGGPASPGYILVPIADYFEPIDRIEANLSGDSNLAKLRQDANAAYDLQNYSEAMQLQLDAVAAGSDSLSLLYAGISALAVEESEIALRSLKALSDNPNYDNYQTLIDFYLILAHVSLGNSQEAQEIADHIGTLPPELRQRLLDLRQSGLIDNRTTLWLKQTPTQLASPVSSVLLPVRTNNSKAPT